MTIPFVSTYIRQQAHGTATSGVIHALEQAAAEAATRGDTITAAALQREADHLRQSMRAGNIAVARRPANTSKSKPLDMKMLAIQWAGLSPDKTHSGSGACVLDCGTRGTAAITANGCTLTCALADDPVAILLLVRHAQLNWEARVVPHGTAEFQFKVAVAAKMLGVKVRRGAIPRARRAEAADLARDWEPILSAVINGNTPTRPRAPTAPMPAGNVPSSPP